MAEKRIHARRWCFTLNNYTKEEEDALKEMDCIWMCFGHEHQEEGTPHLQGAVVFSKQTDLKKLKKFNPRIHWEVMKGAPAQARDYNTKEDTDGYFEKGIMPEGQAEKGGKATKRKWDDARSAAEEGRFEDIPSELWIKYKHSFREIYTDAKADPDMSEVTDHTIKKHFLWLWGPSGTGKSHTARRIARELGCDDPYLKDQNKWWNGYECQKVTIIEEADPKRCEHLASFYKKWCDKWSFTAECKGTVIQSCRPEYIIVTSNYSITECFPNQADWEPLKRRFTEIEVRDRTFQVQWPETRAEQELEDSVSTPIGNTGELSGVESARTGVEPGVEKGNGAGWEGNPLNL